MEATAPAKAFDVYGLRVELTGNWPEVTDDVERDLWWFRAEARGIPDVRLTLEQGKPQLERFDGLRSSFVTARNVVYQGAAATVVDYFGSAATVIDRASGDAAVQGDDPELVREAASNFLISRIGEHLNARGLVRFHGLGLSRGQGATVVLMPSGGGKSTLALRALRDQRVRLLSEDSPLLDRRGLVHPFPLRLALNPTDAPLIPDGQTVRRLERIEGHSKLALDVETWADRVDPTPRPLRHIVIGRRTLSRVGALEPLGRRHALTPLLREAVVGVGVYQGMEFMLQRGWRDVLGKSGTAARRAGIAAEALRQAEVWQLLLGTDRESNWEALGPLL